MPPAMLCTRFSIGYCELAFLHTNHAPPCHPCPGADELCEDAGGRGASAAERRLGEQLVVPPPELGPRRRGRVVCVRRVGRRHRAVGGHRGADCARPCRGSRADARRHAGGCDSGEAWRVPRDVFLASVSHQVVGVCLVPRLDTVSQTGRSAGDTSRCLWFFLLPRVWVCACSLSAATRCCVVAPRMNG